jgi:CheY-like chemotaxis protein
MRGADLTRRLLAFARRQPLQPRRIELNELIAGITKLLGRTLGENIEIAVDPAPQLWPIVADPAQLEASLTNLATNARDAMQPKGGRLTIATRNCHLDEDYVAQHPGVIPGDYVMIEVNDNGCGMPPEVTNQIFDPFFTTKELGKGSGLGLSMVFGFLRQSGGHIHVYSEVGVGTTFRLYLPRAEKDAEAAAEVRPAVAAVAGGRGETVLVVEDNAALRRVATLLLKELGYQVIEADTAAAAQSVLEREPVDLLFSDVIMPGGVTGFELSRIARERWPHLRVVLTSGFPDIKLDGSLGAPEDIRLLNKPYRKRDLARILREALDT